MGKYHLELKNDAAEKFEKKGSGYGTVMYYQELAVKELEDFVNNISLPNKDEYIKEYETEKEMLKKFVDLQEYIVKHQLLRTIYKWK